MNTFDYPIFLRGQEGWLLKVGSHDDLAYNVEPNDVEFREYTCWDSTGRPVGLGMLSDSIVVNLLSEESAMSELMQSIAQFANKFGGGAEPSSELLAGEPDKFYDWAAAVVEQYESEHSLNKRIRRLLKRILGQSRS